MFLTGQNEIEAINEELEGYCTQQQLIVVPCYGTLPFEEQQKMFERTPPGFRKVYVFHKLIISQNNYHRFLK